MAARDLIEFMSNAEVIEAGRGGRTALAQAARENVRNRVSGACYRYERGDEWLTKFVLEKLSAGTFCQLFDIPRQWLPGAKYPALPDAEPRGTFWCGDNAQKDLRWLRALRCRPWLSRRMDEARVSRLIIEMMRKVRADRAALTNRLRRRGAALEAVRQWEKNRLP